MRETHGFHGAFAIALARVKPYRFAATAGLDARVAASALAVAGRRSLFFLDPRTFHIPLEGFGKTHVSELMLMPLCDFELAFEFHDAFLEVVVVNEVAFAVLEAVFAGAERDAFPVLLLGFFVAVFRG